MTWSCYISFLYNTQTTASRIFIQLNQLLSETETRTKTEHHHLHHGGFLTELLNSHRHLCHIKTMHRAAVVSVLFHEPLGQWNTIQEAEMEGQIYAWHQNTAQWSEQSWSGLSNSAKLFHLWSWQSRSRNTAFTSQRNAPVMCSCLCTMGQSSVSLDLTHAQILPSSNFFSTWWL